MSTYPNNILVKPNVVNEVDDVDQGDHNILKDEIIALQQYVGTNPQGDRDNLTSRFNALSSGSGGFYTTNADFDGSGTYPGRFWYRTDIESLRNVKFDGSIQTIGGAFSNSIWHYQGVAEASFKSDNISGTAYKSLMTTKFEKIAGISTLNVNIKCNINDATRNWKSKVEVDGGTAVGSAVNNPPDSAFYWGTVYSVDVSGLNNGTYYDLEIFYGHIEAATFRVSSSHFIIFGA